LHEVEQFLLNLGEMESVLIYMIVFISFRGWQRRCGPSVVILVYPSTILVLVPLAIAGLDILHVSIYVQVPPAIIDGS